MFQDGIKDDRRSPRILRDPRSMQMALEKKMESQMTGNSLGSQAISDD